MFRKIQTIISAPGVLIRYRSFLIRNIYYNISKYFHAFTYYKRKINKDFKIRKFNQGYIKLTPKDLSKFGINTDKIINEIIKKSLKSKVKINNLKPINIILNSSDFKTNSLVFKFITNEKIIKIISNYFGFIPLLTHISYWFSPNKHDIPGSSQEFHLDHEDIKQVKGFFLVNDVTDKNGPTIFINSQNSKNIIDNLNYKTNKFSKRINTKIIKKFTKNFITCTGKKGTLYLIDTSICFHLGSKKSQNNRKILAFQFISPFSTSLQWNWINSKIFHRPYWINKKLSKMQKLILGIN
jgi:hypothetical protein